MKPNHFKPRRIRFAGSALLCYLSATVVLAAGSVSVGPFRLIKKANFVMDRIESRCDDIEVSLKREATSLESIEAGIERGEDQDSLRAALQASAVKIKATSQDVQLSSREAGMVRAMLNDAKAITGQVRDPRFSAALDRALHRLDEIVSRIVDEKQGVNTLRVKANDLAKKIDQM